MEYYLFEVSKGDGKIAGAAVYTYTDYNTAVGNFHSKLGTAMKSDLYTSETVSIISETGSLLKSEHFERKVESEEENTDTGASS